jgi:hypothetical protein
VGFTKTQLSTITTVIVLIGVVIMDMTHSNWKGFLDNFDSETVGRLEKAAEISIGLIQIVGGSIISIGYIFQIVKIEKTKSVDDLSEVQLVAIFIACLMFEVYAIHFISTVFEFFITNTLSCIFSGTTLFQYWLYRTRSYERSVKYDVELKTIVNLNNQ